MAFFGSSWFEDDKPIGPLAHWLEDGDLYDDENSNDRCCSTCIKQDRCKIVLDDDDDDCIEWKQK